MMRMDRRSGGDEKSDTGMKKALSDGSEQKLLHKSKRVKTGTSKGNISTNVKTPAKSETIDGTAKVVSTKGFYRKKKELKEEKNLRRQKRQLTKELSDLEKEVKRMKKKDARKVRAEKRAQSKKEKRLEEIPWEERSQYKARRRAIRRNKKVVVAKDVPQNQSQSSKLFPSTSSKSSETPMEQHKKVPEKKVKLTLPPPEPVRDDAIDTTDLSSTTKDELNDDTTREVDQSSTKKDDLNDDQTDGSSKTKDGIKDDETLISSSTLEDGTLKVVKLDVTVAPNTLLEKEVKVPCPVEEDIKDPCHVEDGKSKVETRPQTLSSQVKAGTGSQILSSQEKKVVPTQEQPADEKSSPHLKSDLDALPSIEAPLSDKTSNLTPLITEEATHKREGGSKKSVLTCSVEPGPTIPMSSPSIKRWAPSPTLSECLSPFYDAIRRQSRKRRRRVTPSPSSESVWSLSSAVAPEKYKKLSRKNQRLPQQSYTVDEIRSMMVEGGGKFGSNITRATLDFRQPKRAFLKDYEKFLAPSLTQVLQQNGNVVDVVDLTCYKVKKNTPPKVRKRMFLNNPFELEPTVQRIMPDS